MLFLEKSTGKILSFLGRLLARYINKEIEVYSELPSNNLDNLLKTLQPGDVLLIEGNRRVSTAIKYLTQSTWSHAALFIGFEHNFPIPDDHCFVEADTVEGVRTVSINNYRGLNTRICRPVGLNPEECQQVVAYAMERVGDQYDMRNVIDLARYLISTPPVPTAYRRRLISLGSGDPTRAICSTLIAQAFQSIRYPVLPAFGRDINEGVSEDYRQDIMHIRHHSLFTPRDFDISPYFQVVKPTLEHAEFDFRKLSWADE